MEAVESEPGAVATGFSVAHESIFATGNPVATAPGSACESKINYGTNAFATGRSPAAPNDNNMLWSHHGTHREHGTNGKEVKPQTEKILKIGPPNPR
jgi:hypothetical protein